MFDINGILKYVLIIFIQTNVLSDLKPSITITYYKDAEIAIRISTL